MKKSILILPRWYPNKTDIQLGTFIQQQAQLIASDFDVSVIYVQADSTAKNLFEIKATKRSNVNELIVYFKSSTGFLSKIINAKRYKKAQQIAFKQLQKKIDISHVHVPYRSVFLALHLLAKQKIPFVITEHWSGHLNGEFAKKNSLDKLLYKRVLRKAAKITCVSKILQQHFIQNTGFTPQVIPNVITNHATKIEKKSTDKINILSVSDLNNQVKNITGLLDAFKIALQQNNLLYLTIIGGGPDENLVKEKIKSLNLENFVSLKGRLNHDEVLNHYSQCDFYCCNSNFETFGMAVAEALLAGKPAVSTNCGGPEEFLNAENSITVPINNSQALSQALLQMADNFKNYPPQKIATEIETNYGQEPVRQLWLNFYNSL